MVLWLPLDCDSQYVLVAFLGKLGNMEHGGFKRILLRIDSRKEKSRGQVEMPHRYT
jgi:hypothetical protein